MVARARAPKKVYKSDRALKIASTMKRNKLDNFSAWRERARATGVIRSSYPEPKKDEKLAELIGVVLGDGHIYPFPRTDELSIFSNENNPGFVARYAGLVESVFDQKPTTARHGNKKCIRIRIYQNHIQKRLGVPYSPRRHKRITVPCWIFREEKYIVSYLRGLYEAEGCFCVHKPTSTYKMLFSNRNDSLLNVVYRLVRKLGFHPHVSRYQVQISRRAEVYAFRELIQFRQY